MTQPFADTIEGYSDLFVDPQYAAYLDINHPENIEATLKNAAGDREIRLIVVTDAEGILGIGDWGNKWCRYFCWETDGLYWSCRNRSFNGASFGH